MKTDFEYTHGSALYSDSKRVIENVPSPNAHFKIQFLYSNNNCFKNLYCAQIYFGQEIFEIHPI